MKNEPQKQCKPDDSKRHKSNLDWLVWSLSIKYEAVVLCILFECQTCYWLLKSDMDPSLLSSGQTTIWSEALQYVCFQ